MNSLHMLYWTVKDIWVERLVFTGLQQIMIHLMHWYWIWRNNCV